MIDELTKQINKKVENCYLQAESKLKRHFIRPKVSLTQRGKSAGSARLQQNELRFNATLLQENVDHFILQTVPHEVAHLLVYQLYGRTKPHGNEWKNIMIGVFNRPPEVTHHYNVTNVEGKRYVYRCGCQDHSLTVRRHNNIQRQKTTYICQRCRETLIYKK